MSCWRIDWTAIGAVATAGTCVIALGLAQRDNVLRRKKEKKLRTAVAALLEGEILELHLALYKLGSLLTSYAVVDTLSTRQELMDRLTLKLMTEIFQSMPDLSAEVLEAIGSTISASHQCHSIIPSLANKNAREDENLKAGLTSATEYCVAMLRTRLAELEKVLGTDAKKGKAFS